MQLTVLNTTESLDLIFAQLIALSRVGVGQHMYKVQNICILYKIVLYKKNYTYKLTIYTYFFIFTQSDKQGNKGAARESDMRLEAGGGVLGRDVVDEVAHAAGVAPLVVVPGDELNEVGAQLDSGVGVEDRGGMAADEIGGDDELVGVVDDSLVLALGGGLDDGLDLLVGGALLKADNEINDGDIESGDTERETPI